MPTRIILDTDIGTDVDDCLALALILGSPELALEGITCVYGNVLLRSRIALKLLALRGLPQIPVFAGAEQPLTRRDGVYWEGHEGQGLLESADDNLRPQPESAVDFIIRTVMDNPGQIHLICIGPLTNAALAILKEPRLAQNLAHLTLMGGVVRGLNRLDLPYCEHNIVCDPDSARIVFTSGAPITVVPLDITTLVKVNQTGLERIYQAGTPFHAAVADQLTRYPRFAKNGQTNLHDPLAVGVVIEPTLVQLQPVHIDVETTGRLTAGATLVRALRPDDTANIQIATAVDSARFETFFIERVEQ